MCVGTVQEGEGSRQNRGVASYDRNCSDDQKEKCREAAKLRRSKEAEYFKELENLLPVPKQVHESDETHLDKNSLIRFSIAYLKTREVINTGFPSSLEKEKNPMVDILSCLAGFPLVLGPDGDVIYTSHNITRNLGISPVDILGHPFSTYVHPCDQHQLKLLTCHNGNREAKDHVEILARIKCLVTERGRMVNLKQASYKSMKISGKIHQMKNGQHEGITGGVFIGVASMVWPDGADKRKTGVFSTKHGMDMRLSEIDTWLCTVGGYSQHHLMGTSFYALVHPQDSKMVQKAFKTLFDHGVCETAPYRLLCSGGGQVWVQTLARVVCRRGKQGQAVVCRHNQCSGVFDRGEFLALHQLRNIRKSNERKRDHQVLERKNHSGRINNNTCNSPAAHSLETSDYATRKGLQNSIKSSIPVIIDRRQNSDKQIIEQDMKVSTEGQPKFVTSTLFDSSESLCYVPRLNMEFVPQTNYPIILEKNDEIMNIDTNAQSRKEEDILDDADFLKNFQQLEESIQMEDLEQLSPHSGYESFTFDKNEDVEFLDFVDPGDFENDYQLVSWTNLLPGTKNARRAQLQDNSMAYQVGAITRKAEDWWEKSNNDNVAETNKVIELEMKTYADVFLQEQIKNNRSQIPSDMTSLETASGTSNNLKMSESMQGIRTKEDQLSPSDWSGTFSPGISYEARKRKLGMKSNLGRNFKKMRFETNMQLGESNNYQ